MGMLLWRRLVMSAVLRWRRARSNGRMGGKGRAGLLLFAVAGAAAFTASLTLSLWRVMMLGHLDTPILPSGGRGGG